MNINILLNIVLGLFGRNKYHKAFVFIDCGIDSVELSKFASSSGFSVLYFDLNQVNPINPVNLILRKSKRIGHLGVAMNFNCNSARDIIKLVNMVAM